MNKNFNKILIFLFATITALSCAKNKIEFTISEQQKVKEYKAVDHEFCVKEQDLDFDSDPIETEIYWRCRMKLAQNRISPDKTTPHAIWHNNLVKKYMNYLDEKMDDSLQKMNNHRNEFINEKHRKICEKRGYNPHSIKQEEVEQYLDCRYSLLKVYQINPPYKKTQYLNRPQDSYNMDYIIGKREDEEMEMLEEERKKYPHCVFLGIKTQDYKKCTKDYDDRKNCLKKVENKKFGLDMQERLMCQKKMYKRFPDHLIKEEKDDYDAKRAKRIKKIADSTNNNSFVSIGVDADMIKTFQSPEAIKKQEELKKKAEEERKEKEEDFNNEEGLYERAELVSLKEKFISDCNARVQPKIARYINSENQICNSIILKWQKKEQNEQ